MPKSARRTKTTSARRVFNLSRPKARRQGRLDRARRTINRRADNGSIPPRDRQSVSELLQQATLALTTISAAAQAAHWLAQLASYTQLP
ncbi:hypothetical protein ACFVXG_38520 [Kitasatospora sp. NPDC058162]|uniref:hypothetical protein n=1 Tax=Kitasatospora sp. NPDC058162 TaxID=3346362 RepID=UPI0036DC4C70